MTIYDFYSKILPSLTARPGVTVFCWIAEHDASHGSRNRRQVEAGHNIRRVLEVGLEANVTASPAVYAVSCRSVGSAIPKTLGVLIGILKDKTLKDGFLLIQMMINQIMEGLRFPKHPLIWKNNRIEQTFF